MRTNSSNRCRPDSLIVILLLGVIAIQMWSGGPSILPEAQAQIPDTGMQRKQLIDEARRTNELLSDILTQLREKPIKVRVVTAASGDAKGN